MSQYFASDTLTITRASGKHFIGSPHQPSPFLPIQSTCSQRKTGVQNFGNWTVTIVLYSPINFPRTCPRRPSARSRVNRSGKVSVEAPTSEAAVNSQVEEMLEALPAWRADTEGREYSTHTQIMGF